MYKILEKITIVVLHAIFSWLISLCKMSCLRPLRWPYTKYEKVSILTHINLFMALNIFLSKEKVRFTKNLKISCIT